jgi:hypothetical protein
VSAIAVIFGDFKILFLVYDFPKSRELETKYYFPKDFLAKWRKFATKKIIEYLVSQK